MYKRQLHVNGANALPSTSGSTPTGHLTLRAKAQSSSHGMFMGVSNASPWSSWIQAQDANNNATNYPLLLNPNGGKVGIGTDSVGDKLVVHQGTDDDIIVRVNGADSTTEFAGLGVGSGYASVVAGGSGTTSTDLVFMTSNAGTEAGRWRINGDGILYNMESGYTYNFKRYQGTMPNMTSNTWSTIANTTTIADAGLWILTFGRFEQAQTGGTQWSVTYVGGPVYLHSANGNDGDTVDVPLYHMGHAQNGSAASCRLTYYSGSAHSTGRVQFQPNGWNYTGTNAYYKFYKIADL